MKHRTTKRYTVKQLADLARVSVRTLHHYDDIGLLKPAWLGSNGYRYYEQAEALRLQQILLYRDMDMSLESIRALLEAKDFNLKAALTSHRQRLEHNLRHYQQLIEVIDQTLSGLRGDTYMQDEHLYNWQSGARQAEYEAWLIERYGDDMKAHIATGRQRFNDLDDAGRTEAMQTLKDIERDLVQAFRSGIAPTASVLAPVLARHKDWVAYMWGRPCPPQAYEGLAGLYQSSPEFQARFDGMAEGFSAYLFEAITAYAKGLAA